ncbi:MAG: TauD/TfdA dioxygenase family protein [Rhodospirillales bacterium]
MTLTTATRTSALEIVPLSPAIGAEVRGVDLAKPLDAATFAAIEQAWLDHVILLFRGQTIDQDQQLAFAGLFGPLGARSRPVERRPEGAEMNPAVMLISNIRKNGVPIGSLPDGEMWFHHDMSYVEAPYRGTFLYAIELPSTGGNTRFANMYKAYDNLPSKTKERIRGLKAMHLYDYGTSEKLKREADLSKVAHRAQPIAITHPLTGRKALYVNRLITGWIEGLEPAESDALLEELFQHAEDPAVYYEHVWRKDDLMMWDNWCSIHARTDFPASERRLLRRCTILGQPLHE